MSLFGVGVSDWVWVEAGDRDPEGDTVPSGYDHAKCVAVEDFSISG